MSTSLPIYLGHRPRSGSVLPSGKWLATERLRARRVDVLVAHGAGHAMVQTVLIVVAQSDAVANTVHGSARQASERLEAPFFIAVGIAWLTAGVDAKVAVVTSVAVRKIDRWAARAGRKAPRPAAGPRSTARPRPRMSVRTQRCHPHRYCRPNQRRWSPLWSRPPSLCQNRYHRRCRRRMRAEANTRRHPAPTKSKRADYEERSLAHHPAVAFGCAAEVAADALLRDVEAERVHVRLEALDRKVGVVLRSETAQIGTRLDERLGEPDR